ncbi:DUF6020 family protein [Streptomyces sp. CA-111067]|uniref:DUF6020 family protein n=1 Tax=Streptomyces sp. CA-111067 TaxID=3240046 RepID=UPI003D95D2EC
MTTISRFTGDRRKDPPATALGRAAGRLPEWARLPLAVGLACEFVLLLWWLAFYPGLMSFDSVTYVWQVTTDNWQSDHSVLYDTAVWLSLQLTGGLAALTFLQTVAMSAALAYTATGLRALGARGRWAAAAALACVIVPSTGTFSIFVWKDSAYAISAVFAFGAITHLTARADWARRVARKAPRKAATAKPEAGPGAGPGAGSGGGPVGVGAHPWRPDAHWWVLAAGMLGLSLFRNNGYPAVVAAGLVLVIAMPRQWRRIGIVTLGPTALALALNFGVYPAAGIKEPSTSSYYAFNYADISVAYNRAPGDFRRSDLTVMAQVAPLSHWSRAGANCQWVDPVLAPPFNRPAAERLNDKLLTVWRHTFTKRPDLIISGHLCRSRIAWALPHRDSDIYVQPPVIPADAFGQAAPGGRMEHSRYLPELRLDPPSARLHRAGVWAYTAARAPELLWPLWTGSLWCWATYLMVFRVVRRRRLRAAVALAAITVGLQLAVIAANPSGLFRYMAALVLLGVLMLPLLGAAGRESRRPTERATPKRVAAEPAPAVPERVALDEPPPAPA